MADPQLLSVDDFAAKIKAKYPDYASIDNATLVQKIVEKHPEYRDQIDFGTGQKAQPPEQPPEQPGFFKRLGQSLGVPTSKEELQQMAAKEQALPWYKQLIPHIPGQDYHGLSMLAGPAGPLADQIVTGYGKTAAKGLKEGATQAYQTGQQLARGEISGKQAAGKTADAAVHSLLQATPFIGPTIETMGQDAAQNNWRGFAGGGLGVAAQILGPKIIEAAPAITAGAREVIANRLTESSAKNLADVLRPTKETTKFLAQNKVIPGMQERGVTAMTGKGLQEKAATMRESAGQAVDDAYDAMPNQPSIATKPVIDRLESMKKDFINESPQPDGTVKQVVLDPDAIQRINSVQQLIAEHGDTLTPQSIRKLRQYFDDNVARGKGYMGKTMAEGSMLDVQKEAANAIRGELASSVPELADANAEFSFWKNLEDVMDATNKRRVGQVGGGLGRKIATSTGAAVGASVGGVKGAVIGAEAGNFLSRAVNSTAWNTVSSKLKMGLADAIASRDPVQVNAAVNALKQEAPELETATPAQSGAMKQAQEMFSKSRALPSDFTIHPEESVNGANLIMKDSAGKQIGSVGIRDAGKIGGRTASEVGDIQVESKGQGYGQALYQKAAEHAAANGDGFLVSSGKPTKAANDTWMRLQKSNPQDIRFINGRWMWKLDKFNVKTGTE